VADAVEIAYDEFTLPNGLRVLVHTDRKAPIVAVNIWYHVGSKDEPLGRSGFAHLFEHLMFQGSENHKGEFFEPFELVGATDQNGTTNSDRTNYFQNVPTTALDMALWMESDRMGHLLGAIDQAVLDEQRGVVQNEKRQGENQPYGQVFERIFAASYPATHPYHHTTIGSMADLNAATLDDVKNWFKSWYGPNNAVLVLAGDIDVATAKAKVARYFGDIAPTAKVKRMKPQIAPRKTSTRETMTDQVPQTRLYRVWNIPGAAPPTPIGWRCSATSSAAPARRGSIAGWSTVTSWSTTCRPRRGAASSAACSSCRPTSRPASTRPVVEKAIAEELTALIAKGPTAAELAQAKTVTEAGFLRGIERIGGFGGKADVLAECTVLVGKPTCYRDSLKVTAATTAAQVKAVGKKWLGKGDYTLVVTPGAKAAAGRSAGGRQRRADHRAAAGQGPEDDAERRRSTAGRAGHGNLPALVFPALERAHAGQRRQGGAGPRPGCRWCS
jgi:zinc protease